MFGWLLALLGFAPAPVKQTTTATKNFVDYGVQFGPYLPAQSAPAATVKWKNENLYDNFVNEAAMLYNIPTFTIKGIIATESGFNPLAKATTTSATGLMQLVKGTAGDMGYAHSLMTDPRSNIMAGTKYLRWLMNTYKLTLNEAIQSYYAGAGYILDWKRKKISSARYEESKKYLAKVQANSNYFYSKAAIA